MKTEKKPKVYKKIEANKLRTLFKREKQYLKVKMYASMLWNAVKKVEEVK